MKAYNEIGFHIDRAQEPTAPFNLQKAKDNTGTVGHALIDEQLKQVGFDKAVKALLQFMGGGRYRNIASWP